MENLLKAMNAVMDKCGYVQKKSRNEFHRYNYAGEADLLDVLRPAMIENGLILIPSVEEVSSIDQHGNTNVRVAYTLAHTSGEVWPEKIYAAGTGNDRNSKGGVGDKGTYKAITGANKYLLFKLFQIETGDEPEAASVADESGPSEPQQNPVVQEVLDKIPGSQVESVQGPPKHEPVYYSRAIGACKTLEQLQEVWGSAQDDMKLFNENQKHLVITAKDAKKEALAA